MVSCGAACGLGKGVLGLSRLGTFALVVIWDAVSCGHASF